MYEFPENMQAKRNDAKKQMNKVKEEYKEVCEAFYGDKPPLDICRELWDLIQACEGLLRKYPNFSDKARNSVYHRCLERGDYERGKDQDCAIFKKRPDYYQGGVEAIDVIEKVTKGIDGYDGFCLGNVIKYAIRAGRKGDAAEDIKKARDYAYRLVYGSWPEN